MSVKPSNLIYEVDEKPPLWVSFILGVQHISIFAISLIFPVVIAHECGGTPEQAASLVSLSMLAGGVGVIVQGLPKGPVGSGYLCPTVCGPSFLSASIVAVKTGGLSLMLGMTMCAGFFEGLFSRVVKRLRFMFPAEVTGLIVAMVGITVIRLAETYFMAVGEAHRYAGVIVACLTLGVMVGLNVWSKGKLKMFCVLIGMAVGYAASYFLGILTDEHLAVITESSFASFPLTHHPGWSFNLHLVVPFIVAMLCSTLKSVGDLTTCQKINDADWKRPDMDNISKGILADAVGCFSAGLLGGFGQSTSSSNVGLSIATGATSRLIAYVCGLLLVVLAFCPKLAAVFVIMPRPVMGATLIFALCFMVIAGFQIIMSRMMDARKTFVVGISLIFGLTVDVLPEAFVDLHPWVQPVFSSSLSAAAVTAIILNLIFRIGIADRATLELDPGPGFTEKIFTFMDRQGGAWGAREEVIYRARAAMDEFMVVAVASSLTEEPVALEVRFDEFNLDVDIRYQGAIIELPESRPSLEGLVERPEVGTRLAGFLIRHYADKVSLHEKEGACRVRLHFDH